MRILYYTFLSRTRFWSDCKNKSGNGAASFDVIMTIPHAMRKMEISTNDGGSWIVKG